VIVAFLREAVGDRRIRLVSRLRCQPSQCRLGLDAN
jgi:hypothetical protein